MIFCLISRRQGIVIRANALRSLKTRHSHRVISLESYFPKPPGHTKNLASFDLPVFDLTSLTRMVAATVKPDQGLINEEDHDGEGRPADSRRAYCETAILESRFRRETCKRLP